MLFLKKYFNELEKIAGYENCELDEYREQFIIEIENIDAGQKMSDYLIEHQNKKSFKKIFDYVIFDVDENDCFIFRLNLSTKAVKKILA